MFVIVLVSLIAGTNAFLTTLPENAAVIEGATVVMKCQTNDTTKKILWRAPMTEKLPRKIFHGERFAKEWSEICFVNNSLPGQYDLIINSTMSAGTLYVCQEGPPDHVNGNMSSAELIVLAADPNCCINRQIEDDKVKLNETNLSFEMRCTVRYSGNWNPLMEWRQEGCQEPIYTGVNTTVQNDTVISTLTFSANVTYNFTRYICTTRFDKRHKPSSTTADNVPNYSYNWTSPIIVITNDLDVTQLCNKPFTTSSYLDTNASSQLTSIISVIAVLQFALLAILLLLLLRRHIKKKMPSKNNDLHVLREADILQHTGHSTSETVIGVSSYDTVPPAYATVNHPIATEQNVIATGQYAIYSEVKATDEDQADQESETTQRSTDPVHYRYPNIGADGTLYAVMKSTNCSQQQRPMKNLFHTSMYAPIDHTIKIPPPPPQATEFLR